MPSLPRPVLAVARVQHGLVTLSQATAAGLSDRGRRRLLADGVLVEVHQGTYRIASHAESFEQRCLAACLAAPIAVLSGPSAGRVYGLRRCTTDEVHVLAGATVNLNGVVGHRTNLLSPADVAVRGHLRILRPARLVCDLAAFLADDDLESVLEQVLDRRMATLPTIRSVARSFVASGRNGSRRLVRVLNGRAQWTKPPESDLELRVLRALRDRGLALTPQLWVELDGGRRVRFDMAEPAIRFAVEVDHVTWHGGRLDVQRDKHRDRAAMRVGWTVARVTDDDVRNRFTETIDQLLAIAVTLRRRVS